MTSDLRLPADLRPMARAARRAGWRLVPTRSNHVMWISPTGLVLITGSTPSDHRALLNHRAALQRAGLKVRRA